MTFDTAFDRLLGHEGGYTAGADDPGGETNWGISKRAYPQTDIKALTRDAAKVIWRRDFWDRVHADELPAGVVFQAFDFAGNSGIETAVRYLQAAVGVADDGHWGPVTRAAAAAMSQSDVVLRLSAQRLRFMTRRSNWAVAGKGWINRMATNLEYGADDT